MPEPSQDAPQAADIDQLLEDCLEYFLPHAPVEDPARIKDFLPLVDEDDARFLAAELVKLDMAVGAEQGIAPSLERYAAGLPDHIWLEDLPLDLVIEEYQLRREMGADPKHTEYAERFPQHADKLQRFSCEAQTMAAAAKKPPPSELAPGDEIDDFQIVQMLGKGAFAQVYLSKQVSMQRLVALKVSAGKGDEPQALAQLDHPNIVRVYDQRMVEGGKTHLLYMQYLPGGTLAEVVRLVRMTPLDFRSGTMLLQAIDDSLLDAAQQAPEGSTLREWLATAPWPMTVSWIGMQLAHALDEAHHHAVLHRDVKPANVLLSAEGVPKLADFNVSFAGSVGRAGAAATLGGSLGYMAPEHLRAVSSAPGSDPSDVAERADFYSLGVLLWELWQGERPFVTEGKADSWTAAVVQQSDSRSRELRQPTRVGDSSERVLEQALRHALRSEERERPASGAELAGRLRLALYPEAADLFDPPAASWRSWLLTLPVLLVTAVAILTPNIAAGIFNYFYNEATIVQKLEGMQQQFETLAATINTIAYPLGGVLLVWFSLPLYRALKATRAGGRATPGELDALFALPSRAALIGGALWGMASIVYPAVLSAQSPEFRGADATHFCLSLLMCGGVAAVYPFFTLALLAMAAYYPRLVRGSMSDNGFDRRASLLQRKSAGYLIAAAAIPLLAIALLLSRETMAVGVIRVALVASIVGLVAAFSVYRYLQSAIEKLRPVLSGERSRPLPGE